MLLYTLSQIVESIALQQVIIGSFTNSSAHTFKANGRDLGALRLAAVCQQIEDRAREGQIDGVDALIDEAEREAAHVCDILKDH